MSEGGLILCMVLTVLMVEAEDIAFTPQDCSLECLRQLNYCVNSSSTFGRLLSSGPGAFIPLGCFDATNIVLKPGAPECEYCRISQLDVQKALGSKAVKTFGSCIPWPCLELMGNGDPDICEHYVHSPNNVTVERVEDPDPSSDTVLISWRPSAYGIAFLRGFQVSLQALGGSSVFCQLFLFHRNVSLPASHSQMMYKSDPFRGLALGSQYAVTVMALPVPEQWDQFYHSTTFSTRYPQCKKMLTPSSINGHSFPSGARRSCGEKNGINKCKTDWYPQHVTVEQNGTTAAITFNLAPQNLDIKSYFSVCYLDGIQKQTNKVDITPNLSTNKTHHTYEIQDLQKGANYSCEIAADVIDAVRKTFTIRVENKGLEAPHSNIPVALLLPLVLALAAVILFLVAAFILTKAKMKIYKLHITPDSDILKQHHESQTQEEVLSWPKTHASPPKLLICYSSSDGPAHIQAVMKLGAFIQQHMATQVYLDRWDSLCVAREGSLAWHCRQIRECDFVLVVCSPGLSTREFIENPEDEESSWELGNSSVEAAISLIGAEVGRAKARGQDLSKYMAAIFEYSEETDFPTELSLVSRYNLTSDFPLLFSHLHKVSLHRPGGYLKISHISEEGFTKLPAGVALQNAICDAAEIMKARRQALVQN